MKDPYNQRLTPWDSKTKKGGSGVPEIAVGHSPVSPIVNRLRLGAGNLRSAVSEGATVKS